MKDKLEKAKKIETEILKKQFKFNFFNLNYNINNYCRPNDI